MIRIKKLLINNFKGVKNHIIIDFQKNGNVNHILSGPNGYGKTTIFEALELCITGQFERVKTFKEVQSNNKNRNKPFFQNTDGQNVLIKLLIENDGIETVITKYYNDDTSPNRARERGRENLPHESHDFFSTYISVGSDDFESIEVDRYNLVDQVEINRLFLGSDVKAALDSIYYLFNYIQQENSIRFLKQKEDEKGESLGFLFGVEQEEFEQSRLKEIVEKFSNQQTAINNEIVQLESAQSDGESFEFQNLFNTKEIAFDKQDPFGNLLEAQALFPKYIEDIDQLVEFKSNFDIEEYYKSLNFIDFNNNVITDESLLNSLLISHIYDPSLIDQITSKNATITKYNKLLELKEEQIIPNDSVVEFFDEEQRVKYELVEKQIVAINKDLGEIGLIMSNLVSANETVWTHYQDALKIKKLSEKNCPLCNSPFKDLKELSDSYILQIDRIKKFNQEKIDEKQRLLESLKIFHDAIKIQINEYLKLNSPTNDSVISIIRNYPNLQPNIERIKNNYLLPDIEIGALDDIFLSRLPLDIIDLDVKRIELRQYLENVVLIRYSYDNQKIQNKELFSLYFDNELEKFNNISFDLLDQKKKYLNYKFHILSNVRLAFLRGRFDKLTNILSRLSSINERVFETIKTHKVEMIEKIKIPFFIYSGKILQNYQQGFGIFIDISPTNNRNNVVLKTGKDSDHDVVFHLSAGQMAVVALAFCLSLNKVYNTNENFKLLAIDDPIQTMDNLNVHSFIELLRNEFSDYQIIMSTHDDFISRYMSYKFEKYNMKATIQNVQNLVLEQTFN
jgi:exonuclease SbcC